MQMSKEAAVFLTILIFLGTAVSIFVAVRLVVGAIVGQ